MNESATDQMIKVLLLAFDAGVITRSDLFRIRATLNKLIQQQAIKRQAVPKI